MMIVCYVPFLLAFGVLGSPAKRDCSSMQCYNVTNTCGGVVSQCLDTCALSPNETPTFTVPPCTASITPSDVSIGAATSTEGGIAAATITETAFTIITADTEAPLITSLPALDTVKANGNCVSGRTMCIQYLQICGNDKRKYGGCHDMCDSEKVYVPPLCTVTTSSGAESMTTTTTRDPAPTRSPCNKEKKWMCAPLGW